jgi:hypothetical protein
LTQRGHPINIEEYTFLRCATLSNPLSRFANSTEWSTNKRFYLPRLKLWWRRR